MGQGVHGGPLTNVTNVETEMGVGNVAWDEDGSKYIKCKALGTIVSNRLVTSHTTAATTERGFSVPGILVTTQPSDTGKIIGANQTGKNISTGEFFWCKVGPVLTCLGGGTGSVAAGSIVYASATEGEADDDATAATTILGVALTATTGSGTTFKVLRALA